MHLQEELESLLAATQWWVLLTTELFSILAGIFELFIHWNLICICRSNTTTIIRLIYQLMRLYLIFIPDVTWTNFKMLISNLVYDGRSLVILSLMFSYDTICDSILICNKYSRKNCFWINPLWSIFSVIR